MPRTQNRSDDEPLKLHFLVLNLWIFNGKVPSSSCNWGTLAKIILKTPYRYGAAYVDNIEKALYKRYLLL